MSPGCRRAGARIDSRAVGGQTARVAGPTLPLPPALAEEEVRRYREEGYLVVRGLLDPDQELGRLRQAYTGLMDELGRRTLADRDPSLVEDFESRDFTERFAIAIGASGGELLAHLDPILQAHEPGFRYRRDLPSAQLPEMFETIRAPRLLDAVEALIGPEIEVTAGYHFNLKLSPAHHAQAKRAARSCGRRVRAHQYRYGFHVRITPWHMDAPYLAPDSQESDIVVAWLPLSASRAGNGCLRLVPRSHLQGARMGPFSPEELGRAVDLESRPGDVIFFDSRTLHSSAPFEGDGEGRWSLSFRYLPTGQVAGRPYLPGFIARSRAHPERELKDGALWSQMWSAALRNVAFRPGAKVAPYELAPAEARAVTRWWRERTASPEDWLTLDRDRGALDSVRDWRARMRQRWRRFAAP